MNSAVAQASRRLSTSSKSVTTVDTVLIGAGVVGLAIAKVLSQERDVLVLESAHAIGTETSSRNSEIIHSGM